MLFIIHRINTIKGLKTIPRHYGVEVDIRASGNRLILQHEAFQEGDDFEEYLKHFAHAFIVLNIKENGIENRVCKLMAQHHIDAYFLLDVDFPYIYRSAQQGFRKIAVRYSEAEPIEQALMYKGLLDWVWIDTNTRLPFDASTVPALDGFQTCLVCPERWGKPEDIPIYAEMMQQLSFQPTAIMTSLACLSEWERITESAAK